LPLFERLYNVCHWLTQDREEAEDLVQETYAKALKGFRSFQLGTNFRAWIYQILRNTGRFPTPAAQSQSTSAHREVVPIELRVRFFKQLHEFPPCCPHGSNSHVLHDAVVRTAT